MMSTPDSYRRTLAEQQQNHAQTTNDHDDAKRRQRRHNTATTTTATTGDDDDDDQEQATDRTRGNLIRPIEHPVQRHFSTLQNRQAKQLGQPKRAALQAHHRSIAAAKCAENARHEHTQRTSVRAHAATPQGPEEPAKHAADTARRLNAAPSAAPASAPARMPPAKGEPERGAPRTAARSHRTLPHPKRLRAKAAKSRDPETAARNGDKRGLNGRAQAAHRRKAAAVNFRRISTRMACIQRSWR